MSIQLTPIGNNPDGRMRNACMTITTIFLGLLLAHSHSVKAGGQIKLAPVSERIAARKAIEESYAAWSKARTNFDKAAFKSMLLPDFYVLLGGEKLTKKQFIDVISADPPGVKTTRFDSTVLTVSKENDTWVAIITEKLEADVTAPDGKKGKFYSYWVTKDGWKNVSGSWKIAYSEALGVEAWKDHPPIANWDA